jgi:hypothetical protein
MLVKLTPCRQRREVLNVEHDGCKDVAWQTDQSQNTESLNVKDF